MTDRLNKTGDLISTQLIDQVCNKFNDNLPVRKNLPLNGKLHIDRALPFIMVYRRPSKRMDLGTEKLVRSEASYIIISQNKRLKQGITDLLENIALQAINEFNSFLIIEIWTKRNDIPLINNHNLLSEPKINLKISRNKFNTETIETIGKALEKIVIQRQKLKYEVIYDSKQWPANLQSLISSNFKKQRNCYLLGIEVEPFYQHPDTGEIFPYIFRRLQQGFSRALKRGVFRFVHSQTTLRPTNYLALGKRALVKAVWEVDQKLAEISNLYDFLLLVTPINIEQSWTKFKFKKYEIPPKFIYRPIPINISSLKLKLYQIPVDQIEDPTLLNLFYEKQIEIERTLTLLRDRGTRNFFHGSMILYGEINDELKNVAQNILRSIKPHTHEFKHSNFFNANSFAERAREEIEYYKKIYPDIESRVEIRNDITGLMVSKGNLLLGSKVKISESRVEALLQHEVGTHILTYINGKAQPFQQLYTGLAGYDELQEGIAVLTEYLVGGLTFNRIRLLAGRVVAASNLIDGASFIENFRDLSKNYYFSQRISYVICARIYRGGGLIKDAVYLRGLLKVLDYLSNGHELESLLVGKISAEHVNIIKELQAREVLKSIPLKPRYLQNTDAIERLQKLRNGINVFELIDRR